MKTNKKHSIFTVIAVISVLASLMTMLTGCSGSKSAAKDFIKAIEDGDEEALVDMYAEELFALTASSLLEYKDAGLKIGKTEKASDDDYESLSLLGLDDDVKLELIELEATKGDLKGDTISLIMGKIDGEWKVIAASADM